jgi:hypothetical protein
MTTASATAGFRLAALVFLFLALGFYLAASGSGTVFFGLFGMACETGFWLSWWHARRSRLFSRTPEHLQRRFAKIPPSA